MKLNRQFFGYFKEAKKLTETVFKYEIPFYTDIDLDKGLLKGYNDKTMRRLSDLKSFFHDARAVGEILEKEEDPVIYEVYSYRPLQEEGGLSFGVTILRSGKIGDEYYMTKGHFHKKMETAEIYIGLKGKGYLLMQTKDGDATIMRIDRGTVAFVPPYWAHRTINFGDEEFVFMYTFPSDAGYDYATIEKTGFSKIVVEKDGKPVIIDRSSM